MFLPFTPLYDSMIALKNSILSSSLTPSQLTTCYYLGSFNVLYFMALHFDAALASYAYLVSDSFIIEYTFSFFFSFYVLSVIFSFIFKHFLSSKGVFFLNTTAIFLFWAYSLSNLNFFFLKNKLISIHLFKWFQLTDAYLVNFSLYVDVVSFSFTLLTLTIGLFVNIYTYSYFSYEPHISRLISLINAFIASMLVLVNSGNLVVFFFGWELIGLTSFFLINFWGESSSTLKSAFNAFSFNKFSDAAILTAAILLYSAFQDLDFENILNIGYLHSEMKLGSPIQVNYWNLVSFFLLSAAFVKSAQIGFHVWLPDSMEAPVPASALIHSATLVSAGVFLIMSFYPILELSFYFKLVTPLVGALTAFVGGVSAVFQTDLNKILAYSTISHCGFMIFLCGFGNFKLVIVYLFVHGFFNAISFLCVGNIIRFSKSYQDLSSMGGLFKYLPAEFFFLVFSLLNLSGLPFFFGFYSNALLFMASDHVYLSDFVFCTILLSCITGLFYSFNIVYYSFFDINKASKSIYVDASHDVLSSFYYSNTTPASNLAILLLILFSCAICAYLVNFFLLSLTTATDFYVLFVKPFSFSFVALSAANLFNFSFFYWVLIVFSLILVFFTYFQNNTTTVSSLSGFFDLLFLGSFF